MTSYTTQNKLQFSLVTKTKEIVNPEELTRMLELDLNENYKNSKPLLDDNKPYLVQEKEGFYTMHMLCHCHSKIQAQSS